MAAADPSPRTPITPSGSGSVDSAVSSPSVVAIVAPGSGPARVAAATAAWSSAASHHSSGSTDRAIGGEPGDGEGPLVDDEERLRRIEGRERLDDAEHAHRLARPAERGGHRVPDGRPGRVEEASAGDHAERRDARWVGREAERCRGAVAAEDRVNDRILEPDLDPPGMPGWLADGDRRDRPVEIAPRPAGVVRFERQRQPRSVVGFSGQRGCLDADDVEDARHADPERGRQDELHRAEPERGR